MRPGEPVQPVLPGHAAGVAQILDDLQRPAQRQHFGARDVLDVIGQWLELAVVAEARAVGVL
jgi:hypothetical protein